MARSRYRVLFKESPHFLTATVNNWIPVFTGPATVVIILDSWRHLQAISRFRIYGYVILENHLHLIAQSDDLTKDVQRFKSWTARSILDHLCDQKVEFLLRQLAFYKEPHKTQSKYQLWQEGSHPQIIESEGMLGQKLDYIHRNPVKRGYVDRPEYWRYSSARNYAGMEGLIEVFTAW